MKKIIILTVILWAACLCMAHAAEVVLSWDPNPEPDIVGYKIYQSTDAGQSWTVVADVNAPTAMLSSVPDSGLILFRVSAHDAQNESVRLNAGAWFNGDWVLPTTPKRSGIE